MNVHVLAEMAVDFAYDYLSDALRETDIIIIDNGSDPPFEYAESVPFASKRRVKVKTVRLDKNIGVYPAFWEALKHTDADILAFIHSDGMICERDWDSLVLSEFERNEKLGLIGFAGSDEIDWRGGRGFGTTSNFQGATHIFYLPDGTKYECKGSPAEVHGRRNEGYSKAVVVDGCCMVFRRKVLEKIKQRPDFPLHHMYDRLLSCETRELGYEVGVLGIAFDHINGQTANTFSDYGKEWAEARSLAKGENENWDLVVYREAERQFLAEYRDQKHFIPCKV
jgi:GT2 family glycosyltransferase